ncbi:MAG: c-type cytochrome [Gammaproteobacteria bacterium]|nr:c-type cytochrome [Gammaproteobacteria bacterium]MCW8910105.1 c-type cytochrome [Gammaproteobacteria bacterium]MCW9005192.1 c-type cytochrome [Gammaproteobacteria bacterium]MCW9055867.1 c-type cytochrome [Gammaproteobacteria bacterium]
MSVINNLKYIFFCLLTLNHAYAASPNQASMLANTCAACHGTNGSSQGPATPSIAGISHDYFIDAMTAFKEDDRPATVMNRIAKGYTEDQIKLMASFFSNQKMNPTSQNFNSAMVKAGKDLHDTHCEKCHAKGGTVSEDDSGILSGQKTPYLRYTITDILNEDRQVSRKMFKRLRNIHQQTGQKGIEQLLHYYASQK